MRKKSLSKRFIAVLSLFSLLVLVGAVHIFVFYEESSNIEIVNRTSADMLLMDSLPEMEAYSTIIIEGRAGSVMDQNVTVRYDLVFEKNVPGAGYTNHDFTVTKVYKGDIGVGDNIPVSLQYFIWENEEGSKQFITSSAVKPYKKGERYLLFLVYNDYRKAYEPVRDYQGIYPIKDISALEKKEQISQKDLSYIYSAVEWRGLISMLNEVRNKYF